MTPNVQMIRRYVTDFVNRQDFSVLPQIMGEGYALDTGGLAVAGRDGAYAGAVARQFEQFPGLVFTLHEIAPCGNVVALRFTEHGASIRHAGRLAAWESIGLYRFEGGRLAGCAIEQDYFSRRRQLEGAAPMAVDPPAIAPWDALELPPDPAAEALVRAWLEAGDITANAAVAFDDHRATGVVEKVIVQEGVAVSQIVSGGDRVAFHARLSGATAGDFAQDVAPGAGVPAWIHCAGIVTVRGGRIVEGHVVRDRWGLYRRLSRPTAAA